MRFGSLSGVFQTHRQAIALGLLLMLVLLTALPVLGPAAGIDPWDETEDTEDIGLGASWEVTYAGAGIYMPSPDAVALAVIPIPEYLSSHIGEKRFDAEANGLLPALILFILTTALFAVSSCVFRQDLAENTAPDTRRYQP